MPVFTSSSWSDPANRRVSVPNWQSLGNRAEYEHETSVCVLFSNFGNLPFPFMMSNFLTLRFPQVSVACSRWNTLLLHVVTQFPSRSISFFLVMMEIEGDKWKSWPVVPLLYLETFTDVQKVFFFFVMHLNFTGHSKLLWKFLNKPCLCACSFSKLTVAMFHCWPKRFIGNIEIKRCAVRVRMALGQRESNALIYIENKGVLWDKGTQEKEKSNYSTNPNELENICEC